MATVAHATAHLRFVTTMCVARKGRDLDEFSTAHPVDEAERLLREEGHALFEYLHAGTGPCKIYLDAEEYFDVDDASGPVDYRSRVVEAADKLKSYLVSEVTGTDIGFISYNLASRHGHVVQRGVRRFKASFRVYFKGIAMPHAVIEAFLRSECLGEMPWDMSVYKASDQLLGAIYGAKSHDDRRILRPEPGYSKEPLDYCAAYVEKGWVIGSAPVASESLVGKSESESLTADCRAVADLVRSCIGRRTSDAYGDWIKVGIALKGIGGEAMLPVFLDFSRKSTKYDEPKALAKWASFRAQGLEQGAGVTAGTLHFYAKRDGPEQYEAWKARSRGGSFASEAAKGSDHSALEAALRRVLPEIEEEAAVYLRPDKRGVLGFEAAEVRGSVHQELGAIYRNQVGSDPSYAGSVVSYATLGKSLGFLHNNVPSMHKDYHCTVESDDLIVATSKDRPNTSVQMHRGGKPFAKITVEGKADVTARGEAVKTAMDLVTVAFQREIERVLDPSTLNLFNFVNNGTVNIVLDPDAGRNDDEALAKAVLAQEPNLAKRIRFAPEIKSNNCNGIYYCDPDTNVWGQRPNPVLEKLIVDIFQGMELGAADKRHVNSRRGRNDILYIVASNKIDVGLSKKLDANLDLFAVDNGVFDVSSKTFRPIEPDDYVSTTAGWSYSAELAREKRRDVEAFLASVLPIEEERNVVLDYFASLLSGKRLEKKFLVLTDKRSGNNGKSTLIRLVRQFFGEYTVVNTPFVCKGSFDRDAESHSAGTEALAGKRLLVAEELKRSMKLDVARLKMFSGGGGVEIAGRRCGSGSQFKYTWQAGIVLIFNEGDCPHFDVADGAFVNRMVVAPMRSKFVEAATLDAMDPDQEVEDYTFPMDVQFGDKFASWSSALADILLERYDVGALSDSRIPAAMKEWRSSIEGGVNPVSDWVDARLMVTGNREDYVLIKDLKLAYEDDKRGGRVAAVPASEVGRLIEAKLITMQGVVYKKKNDKVKLPDGSWKSIYGIIRNCTMAGTY